MADYGSIGLSDVRPLSLNATGDLVVKITPTNFHGAYPIHTLPLPIGYPIAAYSVVGTAVCPDCPDCPEIPAVPTVGIIWPSPGVVAVDSSVNQEVRAASDATYSYLGTAMEGTAESATSWAITRIKPVSPPVIQEAVGAWDNRTALTYT